MPILCGGSLRTAQIENTKRRKLCCNICCNSWQIVTLEFSDWFDLFRCSFLSFHTQTPVHVLSCIYSKQDRLIRLPGRVQTWERNYQLRTRRDNFLHPQAPDTTHTLTNIWCCHGLSTCLPAATHPLGFVAIENWRTLFFHFSVFQKETMQTPTTSQLSWFPWL